MPAPAAQPDRPVDHGADAVAVRRLPEQRRSRERVEQVLDAAAGLIGKVGVDAMTMSDLATAAEVSLPSIYRYFPSKQAIVQVLFERYAEHIRDELVAAIEHFGAEGGGDSGAPADPRAAIGRAMQRYWQLYRDDRALAAVWSAVVADPELVALDVADSRRNGQMLADVLAAAGVEVPLRDLERLAFLASHLAGATVRLGVMLEPDEAERLVDDLVERVLVPLLGL